MRTIDQLKEIAKSKGWALNINQMTVQAALNGLNRNQEREGQYYCPCKIDHSAENICPCLDAPNEIRAKGHCHCQLFYAVPK